MLRNTAQRSVLHSVQSHAVFITTYMATTIARFIVVVRSDVLQFTILVGSCALPHSNSQNNVHDYVLRRVQFRAPSSNVHSNVLHLLHIHVHPIVSSITTSMVTPKTCHSGAISGGLHHYAHSNIHSKVHSSVYSNVLHLMRTGALPIVTFHCPAYCPW